MGRQKIKVVRSLRYSGYLTNISESFYLYKLKKFFSKKNGHVTIRDFKKKNLIFWIVTCVSARDYTVINKKKILFYLKVNIMNKLIENKNLVSLHDIEKISNLINPTQFLIPMFTHWKYRNVVEKSRKSGLHFHNW